MRYSFHRALYHEALGWLKSKVIRTALVLWALVLISIIEAIVLWEISNFHAGALWQAVTRILGG